MESKAIQLPKIPKDKDYEDYLCAHLQAGGLYVERSIIYREHKEILELDILTTDFQIDSSENKLIEIKGGDWGFSDIFKIRGWLTYLKYESGVFIIQKKDSDGSFDYFKRKASELSIDLIDNSNLEETKETLADFFTINPDQKIIETIRFAYLLERHQLKQIKTLKKKEKSIKSYSCLDDYFFKINSGSFFSRDPIRRINQLFDCFVQYKNITARICNELGGGDFNEEIQELSKTCFEDTFYKANDSVLQVSLYVEHIARVTILKSAIEHLIDKLKGNYEGLNLEIQLDYLTLPNSIKSGLNAIIKEKYFHLYPRFWQFFTYVLGGFILLDIKDEEYNLISKNTGIPIEEIPNAFDAYNKLFPLDGGWLFNIPYTKISMHWFFPIAYSGVGANYRRMIYAEEDKDGYEELSKVLSKDNTMKDITKWNNLGYKILNQK
jgi:hypothetical protein